jgi:CDP-diglyceride synthetase
VGSLLAQAFWLAAPVVIAGILHMIVVRRDFFAALKKPLDFGKKFRGEPIFGPNKTWRGLVFMTLAPAVLGAFQGYFYGFWAERERVAPFTIVPDANHYLQSYMLLNAVLGLGYALGELPNSFIKRRVGISPGKTISKFFFVLDQADSVIAALLLGWAFFPLDGRVVAVGIVALTLLHLALNAGLYFAKVRRNL